MGSVSRQSHRASHQEASKRSVRISPGDPLTNVIVGRCNTVTCERDTFSQSLPSLMDIRFWKLLASLTRFADTIAATAALTCLQPRRTAASPAHLLRRPNTSFCSVGLPLLAELSLFAQGVWYPNPSRPLRLLLFLLLDVSCGLFLKLSQ